MELFASVKNGKGEIVEITSKNFTTKKDFKSYLHNEGYKVRFIAKDIDAEITLAYEKYEAKKATAKAKRKAKAEPVQEVSKVEPLENPNPVEKAEPVQEVANAEQIEDEIMNISAYKLNNIYDLIEHLEHFLTKRELVTTISNKFNISNELAVELYNIHIRNMYLDDIE